MSTDAVFAVTQFGLDYERMRMEAASKAIATANTPLDPRAPASAAPAADFAHALGAAHDSHALAALAGKPVGDRKELDPSNPMAGPDGMVHYPDVDMAQEMTTLMSAQRAYQADIRAFNTLHGMMMKALDIGRNS